MRSRAPTAADYRARAARARRLADGLPDGDPTRAALLELALEYDAKAVEAELAERGAC
jgi:hypothetical protein